MLLKVKKVELLDELSDGFFLFEILFVFELVNEVKTLSWVNLNLQIDGDNASQCWQCFIESLSATNVINWLNKNLEMKWVEHKVNNKKRDKKLLVCEAVCFGL